MQKHNNIIYNNTNTKRRACPAAGWKLHNDYYLTRTASVLISHIISFLNVLHMKKSSYMFSITG
jgi:hypothetical protein